MDFEFLLSFVEVVTTIEHIVLIFDAYNFTGSILRLATLLILKVVTIFFACNETEYCLHSLLLVFSFVLNMIPLFKFFYKFYKMGN